MRVLRPDALREPLGGQPVDPDADGAGGQAQLVAEPALGDAVGVADPGERDQGLEVSGTQAEPLEHGLHLGVQVAADAGQPGDDGERPEVEVWTPGGPGLQERVDRVARAAVVIAALPTGLRHGQNLTVVGHEHTIQVSGQMFGLKH
jgi:hypothetical protein